MLNNSLRKQWNLYELIWFSTATTIILILSIIWKDNLLTCISSLAGVISVVLCAKGKISYLYYGIVQCLSYGYIAYGYGLYGESMLNLLFFFPANIVTLILWKRNLKDKKEVINGESVHLKKLNKRQWVKLAQLILIITIFYISFLNLINSSQAYLDGFIVVLSVFAQFLLTFRYVEQWLIWILVNSLTIVLWLIALISTGGSDYGILVMWIAFLLNSIYGYYNWNKLAKGERNE